MRVKCSVVEEFLEELALDAHVVEEGIVRVTLRYQPLPDAPLVALSVVAGVVVGGKISSCATRSATASGRPLLSKTTPSRRKRGRCATGLSSKPRNSTSLS